MKKPPREVQDEVTRALFAELERDWEGLTFGERSALYGRWIDDPAIGGRLTDFMSGDAARTWIKNGPVKEWVKARRGMGRWTGEVEEGATAPRVVRHALGPAWSADLSTQREKPMRVTARRSEPGSDSDDELVVTWGPPRVLKHLVWAALSADAKGQPHEWLLVITGDAAQPVSADDRVACARIAARCSLRIVTVDLR